MVVFYRETLVHVSFIGRICLITTRALHLSRNHHSLPSSSSSSSSYLRSISTCSIQQQSFTVSYLINSCGFTPEEAQKASQLVKFETPDRPDSVRSFFKDHGFSATQISTIIRKHPAFLLHYDPKKVLLPKLEFLNSIGISNADLVKRLTSYPRLLQRSLKKQIVPCYNFCKSVLPSDSKLAATIKRFPGILENDYNASILPNIEHMRQLGVPESNIVYLLVDQPRTVCLRHETFIDVVEEVKQMGLSPSNFQFVAAVHVVASMSKSTWQRKVGVFGKWGWSEDQRLVAFQKSPWCMKMSEEKIMAVMDFFVNTMGLESSPIAQCPYMLLYSLEKRIVPRCSVFQALLSKDLINKHSTSADQKEKKRSTLFTLVKCTESVFLQKFVFCHSEEAPELLNLYQQKMCVRK